MCLLFLTPPCVTSLCGGGRASIRTTPDVGESVGLVPASSRASSDRLLSLLLLEVVALSLQLTGV